MTTNLERLTRTIELDSWTAFKARVESFKLEWIYRGQADSCWGLSSSLERSSLLDMDPRIEPRLIAEYRRAASSYLHTGDIPTTTIGWLALLQHHGTPTRLIDFTDSPYIAAYFAFEDMKCTNSSAVSIWCVNRVRFYQASKYYFENLEAKEKPSLQRSGHNPYQFTDSAFDYLFDRGEYDCIMPFDPAPANQRQLLQQSVFVAAMNPHKTFVEQLDFLSYQNPPIMTKLTVPSTQRNTALRDLERMNITHATLCPGLDGFARALNLRYASAATVGEMGQWVSQLKEDGFVP